MPEAFLGTAPLGDGAQVMVVWGTQEESEDCTGKLAMCTVYEFGDWGKPLSTILLSPRPGEPVRWFHHEDFPLRIGRDALFLGHKKGAGRMIDPATGMALHGSVPYPRIRTHARR